MNETTTEPRTPREAAAALQRLSHEGYHELTGGTKGKDGHLTGGHFVRRTGEGIRWHEREAGRLLLLRRDYLKGKYVEISAAPSRRVPLARRMEARHLVGLADWVARTGVGARQAAQLREAVALALLDGPLDAIESDCIDATYDPLREADAHNAGESYWFFVPSGGLEYSLPSVARP